MSQPIIEASVTVTDQETNPVDLLAAETGLSKSSIKKAMLLGAVWRTQGKSTRRIRRAKRQLELQDVISIYYDDRILATQPPPPKLLEDGRSYSVWYKPPGLMSSGTKFGDHCAINRWVEQNLQPQRPVFIVHRLDRFASGLVLLAHTKHAAANLSAQFQDRSVKKIYRALVEGVLTESHKIELPIDGKQALSIVTPINNDGRQTLVEVDIKTGRKHQIRIHLASLGHPVSGDRQYGEQNKGDLQLTACELIINHPKTSKPQHYILDKSLQPHLLTAAPS